MNDEGSVARIAGVHTRSFVNSAQCGALHTSISRPQAQLISIAWLGDESVKMIVARKLTAVSNLSEVEIARLGSQLDILTESRC